MEDFLNNLTGEQFSLVMEAFMLGRAYEHTEHSKSATCEVDLDSCEDSIKMYEYIDKCVKANL